MNEIIYLKFERTKLYFDFTDERFEKFRKECSSINSKGVSRGTINFWAATIDEYKNSKQVERTFLNSEKEGNLVVFEEDEIKEGQVVQVRLDVASSRKYIEREELFFVFVFDSEGNLGVLFFDTLFKADRYARTKCNSEV